MSLQADSNEVPVVRANPQLPVGGAIPTRTDAKS